MHRSAGAGGNRRELALAHNGNLINAVELHAELRERGVTFSSTSDSEIIAALLATHPADDIEDAIADVMPRLQGAFSTVVMTKDARRRLPRPRRRPAAVAGHDRRPLLRRQRVVRVRHHRRQAPARRRARRAGLARRRRHPHARRSSTGAREAFCVFEYIYFARPDSRMGGDVLQASRGRMGEILAREAPAPSADLVIAVPDSGNAAARGYARASGLPNDDGLIKNRYVGRTFIQPGQELRKHGLRMKFNPLPEIVGGKRARRRRRLDRARQHDAPDRADAARRRRRRGAHAHLRAADPQPCHYGVDMSTREEMIAHERTVDEIAAELGCDSLAYISLAGRLRGGPRRAREPLRRLLHRRLPARRHRGARGQVRLRAPARPRVARRASSTRCAASTAT